MPRSLFDFLLKVLEKRRGEKVEDRDLKTVADLFDRGNRCGIVSSADDIVQGGLRDAAYGGKLVQCNVVLLTKLQNAHSDRVSNIHVFLLTLVG